MNKKVREPFFRSYAVNMLLSILIIIFSVFSFLNIAGTEIWQILLFFMAGAANFIAAMVCFIRNKKFRGNLYSVLCTIFILMALFLLVRLVIGVIPIAF